MLISTAYATEAAPAAAAAAPGAGSAIGSQMILILVLMVMFYLLLIRPQQKRFKEHKLMLDGLQKGDRVVTSGGLIGTIDKLVDDQEVIVDLGNNIKVTALRGTIQTKMDEKKK